MGSIVSPQSRGGCDVNLCVRGCYRPVDVVCGARLVSQIGLCASLRVLGVVVGSQWRGGGWLNAHFFVILFYAVEYDVVISFWK
jgi:hypothetical protein